MMNLIYIIFVTKQQSPKYPRLVIKYYIKYIDLICLYNDSKFNTKR